MRPSVTEIEAMDRAALIAAWAQVFGTPVPKRLSSPFLRRFLGFEPQARESGGLPKGFLAKLKKAARDDPGVASPALKPGGRLIREWNVQSDDVCTRLDFARDTSVTDRKPGARPGPPSVAGPASGRPLSPRRKTHDAINQTHQIRDAA